jgi:hypothetical protein
LRSIVSIQSHFNLLVSETGIRLADTQCGSMLSIGAGAAVESEIGTIRLRWNYGARGMDQAAIVPVPVKCSYAPGQTDFISAPCEISFTSPT